MTNAHLLETLAAINPLGVIWGFNLDPQALSEIVEKGWGEPLALTPSGDICVIQIKPELIPLRLWACGKPTFPVSDESLRQMGEMTCPEAHTALKVAAENKESAKKRYEAAVEAVLSYNPPAKARCDLIQVRLSDFSDAFTDLLRAARSFGKIPSEEGVGAYMHEIRGHLSKARKTICPAELEEEEWQAASAKRHADEEYRKADSTFVYETALAILRAGAVLNDDGDFRPHNSLGIAAGDSDNLHWTVKSDWMSKNLIVDVTR